jgi:type IV pilus assembly protein PilF
MTRLSAGSLGALLLSLLSLTACELPDRKRSDYAPAEAAPSDAQTRARVHTELASGYYEIGNFGVALQEASEALKADASYGPAYNVLGLVYMELREDRPAESNFQQALRLNPLDSDANNNYGWFLCQRKREQESVKYFLAALRNPLYQTPDKSWVNAGICSRQAGDIAGAQSYFERALKARPDQPQALFNLADLAYQRSQYAQAKIYLTQLQRMVTPNPELLWLALRVERRLGDRSAEESLGFQLTKNFPTSAQARSLQAGRYE